MGVGIGNILSEQVFAEEIDALAVAVDVPGAEAASIEVHVQDDVLTVEGTREATRLVKDDQGQMLRQERRQGRFERSITLPAPVQALAMQTQYEDGVLKIILPKDTE